MTTDHGVPRLRAITRPLAEAPDLVSLADPEHPLLWLRDDRGCVGVGEILRLTFTGPTRFRDAAAQWRRIAEAAVIDDPVRLPGTGLVALGAFAFADRSAAESVLVVPRILVARHRTSWWITEVSCADAPATSAPLRPEARPQGSWPGTAFGASPTDPRAGAADEPDRETHSDAVAAYLDGVREAGRRISEGEAEKIVLARQLGGTIPRDADLRIPLRRLADRYLDCWTFAVDGLVGASPETLVRSTSGAVSARVLAGTRARHPEDAKRDARARDELLTSAKEQHEHAFAVQSVVTALSPYVRELHTSEEPFTLRLPNVWHLATDLGASLGERSSALELVGALHPTAAVAGTPTSAAVAAIDELEPFDRGRYSGAVGWIDAEGDGEWVIALRCAQVSPADPGTGERAVVASAGGGIVAGSDPEHELGETVSKLRPITEAFAP
ncbi:isochorismate synthase [Leucobacter triazinivorans]|uniref:isochorismate synthase n=1 Tax=Leucobacter triazinivorans TaxID=1784719 RepID=A0A4P6KG54_9MICO|nr:isochorismate synthase [Leucobacter triazinivorans]QBE49200.1 isochorismate synthase [Leucobacter triazinivorans]